MSVHSQSFIRATLFTALSLVLLNAAPLRAQNIFDAQRVEFTPSSDNNTNGTDGTPLVTKYTLTVYLAGGSTAFATADLGKPTPDPDGFMRVNFSTLLTTPLQSGVIYESTVSAVGAGGSAESARSNTFELTTTCISTLASSSSSVGAAATTGSVGVTATCGWNAVSGASWITVTSGASGTGNGSVAFSIAANALTSTRSGTLEIAGNVFTVNQAAASSCSPSLGSTSATVAAGGGTGSVFVTAGAGCNWTAVSNNASWLTVTSGTPGSGSGTVDYSAAPNLTGASRTGTITIAGTTFTVTQTACGFTVAPGSLSVGPSASTGTLTLTTSIGCTWTASSTATWVTVPASGSGTTTLTYTVAANTSAPARNATLTIGGKPVSVLQAGLPPQAPTNLKVIR